jgi:putative nucleotidyltransferase with HDIG domain
LRVHYRARQFWQALTATPTVEDLDRASQLLSPNLMALFLNLSASEQVHSLNVFLRLCDQGEQSPDVLSAALLHDVGKSRYPLRIWERVAVVIGQALALRQTELWSQSEPRGWKRPFVIARRHADWGAEMAAACGASPLTVDLIRRHHDLLAGGIVNPDDQLLLQLQIIDHNS